MSITVSAQWQIREIQTGSKEDFRGISAVDNNVCWVSGSGGTVLRTTDGGITWQDFSPAGYAELQFRDIHSFGPDTALILSAGLPAVILLTENAGRSWQEVYRNEREGVFFDAMDFWDRQRGIAFSDAPERHLLIIETRDAGNSWQELPRSSLPQVHHQQGGFAASGTCLRTHKNGKVIIGLGGIEATILLSADYGRSWTKSVAPLDMGAASKGVFSVDFIDSSLIIIVGGDYRGDSLSHNTYALSKDGGLSWIKSPAASGMNGKYRSCVLYAKRLNTIISCSRTGINYTTDPEKNWIPVEGSYYSLSEGTDGAIWLSGPEGKVGRFLEQ